MKIDLNNLSDDELDKLFRQSAENSPIGSAEGDWSKMSQILDDVQPKTHNRLWKNKYLIFLFLIIGSTLTYLGINKFGSKSQKVISENSSRLNDKNVQNQTKNIETTKNKPNEIENNVIKYDEIGNKDIKTGISETTIADKAEGSKLESANLEKSIIAKRNDNKSELLSKTQALNKNNNVTSNINSIQEQKITINNKLKSYETEKDNVSSGIIGSGTKLTDEAKLKEGEVIDNSSSKSITKQKNVDFNPNLAKNKTNKSILPLTSVADNKRRIEEIEKVNNAFNKNKISGLQSETLLTSQEDVSALKTLEEKAFYNSQILNYLSPKFNLIYKKQNFHVEVEEQKLPLRIPTAPIYYPKGLALRFAISPDISTVGSNSIEKIGSNFGGLLEYRLNNKFSLQAGVFQSTKYYWAKAEQYKWLWGYTHVKLVGVDAKCKMIDFPVNLRFDMLANKKMRVFGGLGLTTYKMQKETYNYDYEDNSSTYIKVRQWNGKSGTYYSSNLNISIGLEKFITNNISIQVEPFAKSPLKSIGFGKVPLISYGMMFSGKIPIFTPKKSTK